jgi:hypothetical protein
MTPEPVKGPRIVPLGRWPGPRGEFAGHHIAHNQPPIPVTVHVEWTDGGEGELDGWTSQWTRTHVCIVRGLEPGRFRPFWV